MAALGMGIRSEWVWCQSVVSPRVGAMQLCKLHKHASELEQSGGGRGRAEAEGSGGGRRWVEKGKGGHTMTSPPSYAAMSQSGIASPQCQRWQEVVGVEVEEVHGASGCWR